VGRPDLEVDIVAAISDFLIASGFIRIDAPKPLEHLAAGGPMGSTLSRPAGFRGVFWRHPAGVGSRTLWQGRSVADFVGILGPSGRCFWLEIKRARAGTHDHEAAQLWAETLVNASGALAMRARSVRDVADLLGLPYQSDEADLGHVCRRLANLPVWAGLKLRGRRLIEYSSPDLLRIRDEMRGEAARLEALQPATDAGARKAGRKVSTKPKGETG
jgi:hypothetical protein